MTSFTNIIRIHRPVFLHTWSEFFWDGYSTRPRIVKSSSIKYFPRTRNIIKTWMQWQHLFVVFGCYGMDDGHNAGIICNLRNVSLSGWDFSSGHQPMGSSFVRNFKSLRLGHHRRLDHFRLHSRIWRYFISHLCLLTINFMMFFVDISFSGFIHRFLSWKIFLPLSRMSYAVYLIHLNFAISYGSQSRKPFYVSELSMIVTSLGIVVYAFLLASVVTVTVEMPFLNLDKLFFPNHSKASESKYKDYDDIIVLSFLMNE